MAQVLDHLPSKLRARLDEVVAKCTATLGPALREVALTGAAVHPDRPDRARGVELLLVVSELSVAQMQALAGVMRPYVGSKGLRFRTVSEEELRDGLDVYALEFAQWRAYHVHLAGEALIAALEPEPAHLRHELERSLRGVRRRARNRLIQSLAARASTLELPLAETYRQLLVIAHHSLALAGQTPPQTEVALLEAFAVWLELDATPYRETLERLRHRGRVGEPFAALEQLERLLAAACAKIDTLEVRA